LEEKLIQAEPELANAQTAETESRETQETEEDKVSEKIEEHKSTPDPNSDQD